MTRGGEASRPAPPPGFMVSEQTLESPVWRLQLDLATGGLRSLIWRKTRRELVDADVVPHLFQPVAQGAEGLRGGAWLESRARFDADGARLTVRCRLGSGVWRTEWTLDAATPAELRLKAGWEEPEPGLGLAGLALPLPGAAWMSAGPAGIRAAWRDFGVTAELAGAAWRPETGAVWAETFGGVALTLSAGPVLEPD